MANRKEYRCDICKDVYPEKNVRFTVNMGEHRIPGFNMPFYIWICTGCFYLMKMFPVEDLIKENKVQ